MKKTTRRNNYNLIMVMVLALTIGILAGCGNAPAVATTTPTPAVEEQPKAEPTTAVEEVVEAEPEVTEEVVEPEVLTLEDWAKSVQTTEVVFGIYNENTNEGKLLETAELDKNTIDEVVDEYISLEKYSVTDGDLLVIVCPGTEKKGGGDPSNLKKVGEFYVVYTVYNITNSIDFNYGDSTFKIKYDFN